MHTEEIDIGQTHIRLKSDIENHGLKTLITHQRHILEAYIRRNPEFYSSIEPLNADYDRTDIVKTMLDASRTADVGPMACVAGSFSELCLNHLIDMNSKYSIIENGGDIALVNDRKVLCGIYSNNPFLKNSIAFEIKPRKSPLGICTSSGKIGHSISFGEAESVTVIAKSTPIADGLATGIANDVRGDGESRVSNALESAENYREFFRGVLIISGEYVGTVGKIPKIVESEEFEVNKMK